MAPTLFRCRKRALKIGGGFGAVCHIAILKPPGPWQQRVLIEAQPGKAEANASLMGVPSFVYWRIYRKTVHATSNELYT